MKAELFVSQWFEPCRAAERVWNQVAREQGVELAVIDVNSERGQQRATELGIGLVPALAVDGKLCAVGVQTADEVRSLLRVNAPG